MILKFLCLSYSDGVAHVNLNAIDELDLRDCDIRSVHLEPEKLSNLTSLNMMGNLLSNFSGLIYLKGSGLIEWKKKK